MLTELLTRNKIDMGTVIMDGCYVAHQGKISGKISAWTFKKYKNTGKTPGVFTVMIKLMGQKKEDISMLNCVYMGASDESVDRNFIQNYTYRTRPEIADNPTMVHMWCGSKEPYAIKSHNILKKYLKNYEEEIMHGFGHGEFLFKHRDEICAKIVETLK